MCALCVFALCLPVRNGAAVPGQDSTCSPACAPPAAHRQPCPTYPITQHPPQRVHANSPLAAPARLLLQARYLLTDLSRSALSAAAIAHTDNMAELLMECEEEELEPWQQRAKEVDVDDDDDDDEPIFVREISGSKTPNTNNTPVAKPGPSAQVENGTPTRGVNTFQTLSNHYKPPAATHSVTQPMSPMYLPITRPVTSSAVVQPLPRPIGMQEPIRRPLTGCLPAQQPPRPNLIMQPACRPMTFTSNTQPVCRNVTFPTLSQPALRPVATITAQPVILNQGYIVNSPQVSSNNSPNVMYALRQSTPLSQYQSVQTITTTGSSPLARPLQPLPQIRPVSTPARTAPTYIYRPTPPIPSVMQNNMNLVPVLQQPLQQNSQKTQQTILTQSSAANIGRSENALLEKRSAPPDVTIASPKKPKTNENVINNRPVATSTTSTQASAPMRQPTTQSHTTPTKGTGSATTPIKNGTAFPQACPKCNIHFNLLEPMKKHMTYCCPEKMQSFGITSPDASNPQSTVEENDKGKLIMLVSDFYYGKHSGDPQLIQQEQKTHTTFKCFSCQKVLKNNVRFMNHMKHHLELEKQSTESWENHTTCHHCYRQFPTPFQLQCHIESSHTLYESTTICKICELSFDSEQILLQHMKDSHKPGEMPYVCQVCNYRSSLFGDVDSHFRSTHENTKSLLCPFCLKVIKSGTPFMQHYMKHQNKGVYRCAKCRLQFLTCKEKMDHKTQHHRTFRKPKQLEGLPPGTKVTIRASIGAATSPVTSPTSSISKKPVATPPQKASQPPPAAPPQPPPKVKNTTPKIKSTPTAKVNVQSPKVNKVKSHPKKPVTPSTTRRMKTTNTALRNIRFISGVHKCMECHRQVVDFEGHFHTYVHCSKCKFSTSCNKAYTKHMMSFHGRNSSKRSKASRKGPKDKRRITVVCLNCDFLTDVSGLDDMAKHLSESHTHSCQVVTENVSIFSSTHEGDMSKSRLQSSIKQKKITHQYEKPGSNIDAVTDDSKTEKYTPGAAKNKKNACGSIRTSHGQRGKLLYNRNTTSVDQVNMTSDTPDSCSPKPEEKETHMIDSNNKDSCDIIQEKLSCEETSPEPGKPADNNTVTTDNEEELRSVGKVEALPDSKLASDAVGFEQFLRKEAPDSVSSDISEPSSVHLDPLTPSEVLEHEATEILQKGTTIDSQKGSNEEETEDAKDSSTNTSALIETEEEQEAVL
ncbi:zinc finger protein 280D isoform X2 [Pseudophryne corroboree]|uniref:zinc finger protein 280D isoform X2 n=1 Tax=Pseudophryne corroboree TaxID=495146 RepID=UPI003081945C